MLRVNLLVTGSDEVRARFVVDVLPNLRPPVSRWTPGRCLLLPTAEECGTLIIENVDALPSHDQRRLFDWLTVTLGRTQVVSTAANRLVSLVETGNFFAALYYRLNTICIDVTAPSADVDAAWALSIAFQELQSTTVVSSNGVR